MNTGDIGLLVGLATLYFANDQSFNIAQLNERALHGDLHHSFLVIGAVGGGFTLFLALRGQDLGALREFRGLVRFPAPCVQGRPVTQQRGTLPQIIDRLGGLECTSDQF